MEEYDCYKCEGTGKVMKEIGRVVGSLNPTVTLFPCHTCWGSGKLDWAENARGGKGPITMGSSGTSGSSSTPSGTSGIPSRGVTPQEKKEYFRRRKSIYKKVKESLMCGLRT